MVQRSYVQNTELGPGRQSGQAFMIMILLVIFSMLVLISIASAAALREARISELDYKSTRSFFLSESGIEDAVYRANTGKFLAPSYSLSLYGASTAINVINVPGGKEITSYSNFGNAHRTIKATLAQGSGVGFAYAVQVGEGGIELENSSKIIGSVYSNGNISGKNTAEITLDAFAASSSSVTGTNSFLISGNARGHSISGLTVGKSATSTTSISNSTIGQNAYANNITSSTITRDAYYSTSISGSSVGGSSFPGTPAPADLPKINLPISDAQISDWEAQALSGGVHSSPCPYVLSGGTTNLGPIKINCDFTITGDAIVVMHGTIWVAGNFNMSNTSQLKLDSSYGSLSDALIVDNPSNRLTSSKIIISNSAKVLGSGTAGSYIALISQNNSAESGGGEIAILPKNTVDASIYYAPHGKMEINNSTSLKEASAYEIEIKNSATVTYESGLASVMISGPTGGYDITGWLEVP
ncbi:hypothetical protein HYT00_01105 [Candidatus Giovannonibacteria bacterium]|nr:hypothetical protein [Candidatus Giovannonibacteria bacterium]